MARVSLILLRAPGTAWPSTRVADCRAILEARGHDVEVLAVSDPARGGGSGFDEPGCRGVDAQARGLAGSAVAGLREAEGDLLVLLDQEMGYSPEDLLAVVDRLAVGDVDLVVASRNRGRTGPIAGRLAGAVVRPVFGTTDPFSGLIGLTAPLARATDASFRPVGSRFSLEILARAGGRRADVPVGARVASAPRAMVAFNDIRQAKRLADDRFGNASRLIQFCFVGASGMVVDLSFYALFQRVFFATPMASQVAPLVGGPLAVAVARVLAIAIALTWNFSLNRRLTFNDAKRGSIVFEFARYVVSNLVGILLSLTLSLTLPNLSGFFRSHRLAAAVVGIVAATGVSFTLTRWFVFGRRAVPAVAPAPAPHPSREGIASRRVPQEAGS